MDHITRQSKEKWKSNKKRIRAGMLALLSAICIGAGVGSSGITVLADATTQDTENIENAQEPVTPVEVDLEDGEYAVSLDLEGGSGKATVTSPTLMIVRDGKAYARIEWSSSNYDYMIVGTEKYLNTSEEDANSVFEIPIGCWDEKMPVIGDTIAMGTPHEVNYTMTFYSDSVGSKGTLPQEAAKRVVIFALIIIIGGGILNHFVQKRRMV